MHRVWVVPDRMHCEIFKLLNILSWETIRLFSLGLVNALGTSGYCGGGRSNQDTCEKWQFNAQDTTLKGTKGMTTDHQGKGMSRVYLSEPQTGLKASKTRETDHLSKQEHI